MGEGTMLIVWCLRIEKVRPARQSPLLAEELRNSAPLVSRARIGSPSGFGPDRHYRLWRNCYGDRIADYVTYCSRDDYASTRGDTGHLQYHPIRHRGEIRIIRRPGGHIGNWKRSVAGQRLRR
jgi:hypothetical protein